MQRSQGDKNKETKQNKTPAGPRKKEEVSGSAGNMRCKDRGRTQGSDLAEGLGGNAEVKSGGWEANGRQKMMQRAGQIQNMLRSRTRCGLRCRGRR